MQKKGRAGTSRAGKIALYGMMTALAFLLSYVETLIPTISAAAPANHCFQVLQRLHTGTDATDKKHPSPLLPYARNACCRALYSNGVLHAFTHIYTSYLSSASFARFFCALMQFLCYCSQIGTLGTESAVRKRGGSRNLPY